MLTFHSLSALPIIVCCCLISSLFWPRLVRLLRRVPVTSTVWTPICSRVLLTTRLTKSGDNESVAANGAGIFECDNGDNSVGVGSMDESAGIFELEFGNGNNDVGVQTINESVGDGQD